MRSINPVFVVFFILATMSITKMLNQNHLNVERERVQRICATLPQPHPDCR